MIPSIPRPVLTTLFLCALTHLANVPAQADVVRITSQADPSEGFVLDLDLSGGPPYGQAKPFDANGSFPKFTLDQLIEKQLSNGHYTFTFDFGVINHMYSLFLESDRAGQIVNASYTRPGSNGQTVADAQGTLSLQIGSRGPSSSNCGGVVTAASIPIDYLKITRQIAGGGRPMPEDTRP